MKLIPVGTDIRNELYVKYFGLEDISQKACWNKGRRDYYILHFVLSGYGFFNNKKVMKNQGFLIKSGELCEYHSSVKDPWKYFFIIFDGKRADEICGNFIQCDGNNIFDIETDTEFLNLINDITSKEGQLSHNKALGYFFLVLSFFEKKNIQSENSYVRHAKNIMKFNFNKNISITEVAREIGISDRYLYNLFIKHEKIAPKKYLNALKLMHAKSLLVSTHFSITDIANSCGFYDVLSFSRFFSKNMNMSPKKYREVNFHQY